MMDAKGKPIKLLGDHEISDAPSWSSDGKKFAAVKLLAATYKICEFDLNGKLLEYYTGGEGVAYDLSWSSHAGIYVYESPVRVGESILSQLHIIDNHYIQMLSDQTAMDLEPDISGDGSRIAFVSTRDLRLDGDRQLKTIYTMDISSVNGHNVRKLTGGIGNDSAPRWSPDGKQIAFHSERNGNTDIYVMDADGSNLRRLTKYPGMDRWPTWSPDGKKIAYASDRSGNGDIYVLTMK